MGGTVGLLPANLFRPQQGFRKDIKPIQGMTNKELHYLIGNCLAIDRNTEVKERIALLINSNRINWDRFVWICSNNLVLQTIYVKFRDNEILKLLPPELALYLKEIYDLNLDRNKQILLQIEEINKNLNTGNIRPVYIKGAGNLIDKLYKDPGERIMADIDLLVAEKDFLPAAKIVEAMGYSIHQPIYEEYSGIMHYPSLYKEGLPADVEIHRSPVMLRWSAGMNEKIISGDKKECPDLKGCNVPSDAHKVILNFIHSQLSNGGSISGLVSLRDLYDLYLLAERTDINRGLEVVPYKRRAASYVFLASKLFGEDKILHTPKMLSPKIYLMHYNLNLSSPFYYHSFRLIRSLSVLIFIRYLGKIPELLFNSQTRKTVYRKMRSREWYKAHVSSYSERFR
jgi:hypothetical protein